jgi:hypothetical protein
MTDKDADWHFGQFMSVPLEPKQQKMQNNNWGEKFNCNLLRISFSTVNVQIGTTWFKFCNFAKIDFDYIKYILSGVWADFSPGFSPRMATGKTTRRPKPPRRLETTPP